MTDNLVLGAARMTASDIFNATVASSAIGAAWEVGALDELAEQDKLDVAEFSERNDLDQYAVEGMFQALASVRVVQRQGALVVSDVNFTEVYRGKAFYHWLSRGCAALFADMPAVLKNENRVGSFYRRDAAAIAIACRDINANFFDPVFKKALGSVGGFSKIADLGCGSGERIISVLRENPDATGLGIDIAEGALGVARASTRAAGFEDRVSFVKDDATNPQPHPEFADVDLLTSFLMGHDFWPRENCVTSLRGLRKAFPNVKRFLLGDTAMTTEIPDSEIPVFTLGFEVAHRMMGAYLPTLEEWNGVFAEGGWRLVEAHLVVTPADSVIFELEPLAD
ncbi:methyltransferase domain-containing protein [Kitasatospora sp. NPDC056446]|uniref:methyltransferase domain-containing protein n=1 Tax=Kitasatospora sp. NPDC056446 TaxID=3345819 RepID=UPI0036AA70F8